MRADLQQPRVVFADSSLRYQGQAYAVMAELLGCATGYDLNGWPLVNHDKLPIMSMRWHHKVGCTREVDWRKGVEVIRRGGPA